MQQIEPSIKEDEILALAQNFETEYIDDILYRLKAIFSSNENDKISLTINSGDIVYDILTNVILNKYRNYYQTYKEKSLYLQVVENIEKEIITRCGDNPSILNNINALSEITYESQLCSGNLMLDALSNISDFTINPSEFLIKFEENDYQTNINFDKSGLRYLRKLLQIAQKDLCLVLSKTSKGWAPIGYVSTKYQELPVFSITGPLSWTFKDEGKSITFSKGRFIVNNPKYHSSLSKEASNDLIIDNLIKDLKGIDKSTVDLLIKNIKNNKDIHGALLVFIDDEQQEAIDNLCIHKRGIRISNSPFCNLQNKDFSENYFLDICKIDGAVVFNKSGQLLSIGTILDGCVIKDGDVGRGSRYNSTKTFVEFYSQPKDKWLGKLDTGKDKITNNSIDLNCIGLVISEDKNINLICNNKIW